MVVKTNTLGGEAVGKSHAQAVGAASSVPYIEQDVFVRFGPPPAQPAMVKPPDTLITCPVM